MLAGETGGTLPGWRWGAHVPLFSLLPTSPSPIMAKYTHTHTHRHKHAQRQAHTLLTTGAKCSGCTQEHRQPLIVAVQPLQKGTTGTAGGNCVWSPIPGQRSSPALPAAPATPAGAPAYHRHSPAYTAALLPPPCTRVLHDSPSLCTWALRHKHILPAMNTDAHMHVCARTQRHMHPGTELAVHPTHSARGYINTLPMP